MPRVSAEDVRMQWQQKQMHQQHNQMNTSGRRGPIPSPGGRRQRPKNMRGENRGGGSNSVRDSGLEETMTYPQ